MHTDLDRIESDEISLNFYINNNNKYMYNNFDIYSTNKIFFSMSHRAPEPMVIFLVRNLEK